MSLEIRTPRDFRSSDVKTNVLVVDFDGTLIESDVFIRGILSLASSNVSVFFRVMFLIFTWRKAKAKALVAKHFNADWHSLGIRKEVVEEVQNWKRQLDTRKLILASGANEVHLQALVQDFDLVFDAVIGSDDLTNSTGSNKLQAVVASLPPGTQFTYLCDGQRADRAVMGSSAGSIILREAASLRAKVLGVVTILRPQQWAKNALVLLGPLIYFASVYASPPKGTSSQEQLVRFALPVLPDLAFALVVFSLAASAGYVFNDLVDLDKDRVSSLRKHRPLPAKQISIGLGFASGCAALSMSLVIAIFVSETLVWLVLGYLTLTLAYTLLLKKLPILDVFSLASFYIYRIYAGVVLAGVVASNYFYLVFFFLFLSLAFGKRYSHAVALNEVALNKIDSRIQPMISGSGDTIAHGVYQDLNLGAISSLGISSGYLAAALLGVFSATSDALSTFSNAGNLVLLVPVTTLWITGFWFAAIRRTVSDPLDWALKTPFSLAMGVLAFGVTLSSLV